MADTLGSIIDKLTTCGQKMFLNQEELYKVRRMTFEEYRDEYFLTEEGARRLWEVIKKCCDINVQRNALINEFDVRLVEMMRAAMRGEELDNGSFVQRAHKTY